MKDVEYWQMFVPHRADWVELAGQNGGGASFAQGDEFVRQMYNAAVWTCGLTDPGEEFDLVTSERFSTSLLGSPPPKLRQLQLFVRMLGARRVLEVGTFIGISTLYFAQALPRDGEVVTLEKFDHFAGLARENFVRNGMADKIRLVEGDALAYVRGLAQDENFDLIFIDGDKEHYLQYFQALEPHMADRGMILVDDVFFHGDSLREAPRTDKGLGVRALLTYLSERDDLFRCVLPIGASGMLSVSRQQRPPAFSCGETPTGHVAYRVASWRWTERLDAAASSH